MVNKQKQIKFLTQRRNSMKNQILQNVSKSNEMYLKYITNQMLKDKQSLKIMGSKANIKAFNYISFRKVLEDYIGKMDVDEKKLYDKFENKLGQETMKYYVDLMKNNYSEILNSM
jgi:hypothetical protein